MIEITLAGLALGAMAALWWSLSPASDPAARRAAGSDARSTGGGYDDD